MNSGLLSSEDIRANQAEAYGYINRALPDADLDAFLEALATRIENGRSATPRQHQPAARGRTRCRVGCVHRFARPTRRPGRDQTTDGAGVRRTGGCEKSARTLPGSNRTIDRRCKL